MVSSMMGSADSSSAARCCRCAWAAAIRAASTCVCKARRLVSSAAAYSRAAALRADVGTTMSLREPATVTPF